MFSKKVAATIKVALFFVLLNLPAVYELTNKVLGNTWDAGKGCPTLMGVLVHSVVFFLISYLSMGGSALAKNEKMMHSLKGALLFALLSSAPVYKIVDRLFAPLGVNIANHGCPTMTGVVVHAVVFAGIVYALMQ